MRKILVRSFVFCTLIAVCLCCQVVRVVRAQADVDKGIKELQGKWRAVEMQTAGISTPKEVLEKARLEIKEDEWIWLSGGPVNVKSRIRLDPSKSPKEIDITMLDGPGKGSTFSGIYALEKGQLRVCYSHTKGRPKDFKTERGQLRELLILEREKPRPRSVLPSPLSGQEPTKGTDKLEGKWVPFKTEIGGKKVEDLPGMDEIVLSFEKGKVKFEAKQLTDESEYRVNDKKMPKEIDFIYTGKQNPERKGVAKGIYRVSGDELTICSNAIGSEPRPTKFATEEKDGLSLEVFKRKKLAASPPKLPKEPEKPAKPEKPAAEKPLREAKELETLQWPDFGGPWWPSRRTARRSPRC